MDRRCTSDRVAAFAVQGVGTSLFGKQPELSAGDLVRRAVFEALDDAGSPTIDAVFAGTVFGAPGTVQRALQTCGIVEGSMIGFSAQA